MLGTVPRLSWPKLGAATSRIINVYCRKNVPSRPARYVDMPPLQKAALPETTNCSRYVWLSNTTGNLGPANSHGKRSHGIVAGWFAKEMRNIKFVFPAASDFVQCLARHVGILPFGGGSASCWAGLQTLEAAATPPECKTSAGSKDARGAGGSLQIRHHDDHKKCINCAVS